MKVFPAPITKDKGIIVQEYKRSKIKYPRSIFIKKRGLAYYNTKSYKLQEVTNIREYENINMRVLTEMEHTCAITEGILKTLIY